MDEQLGPYLLGPNDTEENGIYIGDARELAKAIPDESVDLIFTDPVYDRIDDYRWLAEMGTRTLRDDRPCLVWTATASLPDVLRVMIPPLNWAWMFYCQKVGPCFPGKPGICVISECLWLEKGHSKTRHRIADWIMGDYSPNNYGRWHRWSKPINAVIKWTDSFTRRRASVFDPFTGGGTVPVVCKMLGRRYLAFEIDPDTAQLARERVRLTQPPLFVPQPEQLSMDIE